MFLNTLGNYFIAGGDYNAKHSFFGSRITNTKDKELYKAGNSMNRNFISRGGYVYWPSDPNKLPDFS